jgi:hypothetical protein
MSLGNQPVRETKGDAVGPAVAPRPAMGITIRDRRDQWSENVGPPSNEMELSR